MIPWRILWKAEALFLVLLVGCGSIPRAPRVEDIGQGRAVVHIPRTADLQPVTLEEEEFQQALRRLAREVRLTGTPRQTVEKMFQMDPQFGNYLWLEKDQKLVPLGPGEPLEGGRALPGHARPLHLGTGPEQEPRAGRDEEGARGDGGSPRAHPDGPVDVGCC